MLVNGEHELLGDELKTFEEYPGFDVCLTEFGRSGHDWPDRRGLR